VRSTDFSRFKHNNRVYHVTYDTKKPTKGPERIDLVKDGFPLFKVVGLLRHPR